MRWIWSALAVATAATSFAQQSMSLEQALKLASERNGTLRSARQDMIAANARSKQALAAFLPTVTPSISYSDSRRDLFTGVPVGSSGRFIQSGWTTQVDASWNIFDSGEKDLGYRGALSAEAAQNFSSLQTLRSTLFDVISQYFEVLRTTELVKVQAAQVARADEFVKQVQKQIDLGDAARIDAYQPEADSANAKVNQLSAEARGVKAETDFRATIGLAPGEAMLPLEGYQRPKEFPAPGPLESYIKDGLKNRADLRSKRASLRAQELGLRQTKLSAGITWTADIQFTKQFGPDNQNNRLLTFGASIPLFDGRRSAERVREVTANFEGSKADLEQSERQARSDIEASYRQLLLNAQRVDAAQKALEAARVNYDSVEKAYSLKVATIVERSTANVTLVTAETNYVEAMFDYAIAENSLRLASGQPLPGESG